jgi:hypothetical protein
MNPVDQFTAHGMRCAMQQNSTMCGYVAVPSGHPLALQLAALGGAK